MSGHIDVWAIKARFADWYRQSEGVPRTGDWSLLDTGESLGDGIVREDVPDLILRVIEMEDQNTSLRKVIEDAPHVSPCVYYAPTWQVLGEPCTCWKSKALPEREDR